MRLVLVTQDFPPAVGGIETYAVELAKRLAPACTYFGVVAPNAAAAGAADRALAFPVHRVPPGVPLRPDLLGLVALPFFPLLARRHRLDVAFHAQWPTALPALVARRLTGFPRRIVVAAHGRELLFNPAPHGVVHEAYDRLRRFVLRAADAFVPVSRYTAGLLESLGVDPRRITVVSNGTDPDRLHPQDASPLRRRLGLEGRRVLLTVARLVERKGIDTVLRALPAIVAEVPDAVYLVAGTGPDRERLARLAAQTGVAEHVRFLGTVPYDDLPLYYNAGDVFIMPSRAEPPDVEGFGIVFREASACATPVVGAHTGGIPDAVHDGETGLLVPPDDPAALAATVVTLLNNEALARQLGAKGRRLVEEHGTWQHSADQLYALFSRLTEA